MISDTPDTVYGPEAVRARQLREAEREASQTEVAAKLAWLEVADRKAWTLARSGEEERKRGEERTEREIREREGSRDRIYYLHGDHLGTPQEVVGEDGGVVWQAAYKAWGRIHRLEKGEISQPFRFQGQYEDEETGLYYNRHRYYDPDTARYLTQDPIGLAGGNNLYAYTPNSTGWVDPLGLAGDDTLKPGPYAGKSIPARGPARDFTLEERTQINEIGKKTGCHTCGTTNPGTKSGDFIPDHQTPNALNTDGEDQRLYPHCRACSLRQAGQVTQAKRNKGGK